MIRPLATLCIAGSLLLPVSQSWAGELNLNGSASYQDLSREYYIAALYLSEPGHSAETVTASTAEKQMRILVRTRWTPGQWQKQWQANISINNDVLPSNPASREALMAFIRLPRKALQPGDEVRISANHNGTKIFLNNEQAIHTSDRSLFRYLLNTWIGKFPPSRDFRGRILQQVADEQSDTIKNLLNNHQIPAARVGLLSAWREQERQKKLASQQEQRRRAEAAAREKARIVAAEKARKEKARQAWIAKQNKLNAAKQAQLAAEKKAASASNIKPPVQAKAATKPVAKTKTAEQRRQESQEQQKYFLHLYQWQLQQALEKEVRYPPWARQFHQQGEIFLTLTLGSKGDIQAILPLSSEHTKLLSDEVERASRIVTTQVKPPQGLNGSPWTYTLGYRFSLTDDNQPQLKRPQVPKSLAGKTAQVDKAEQLIAYKQKLREQILAKVVYPKAARILKKQGEVSYQFTLDKQGNLTEVETVKSSRHRELNKALKKAIDQAAPFSAPPVTSKSDDNSFSLLISYQFKL